MNEYEPVFPFRHRMSERYSFGILRARPVGLRELP